MAEPEACPFHVGQVVFYRPSERVRGLNAMIDQWADIRDGQALRIAEIRDGAYIVPDNFSHPGGGLHWSAFAAT
ncbi:hypothetical protein [Phenylobacterium hankyongense]|uniref:hypothetical protein n=1 Tax=Phenylobacterium hankyongense TaxID=1813876 RepID=UPI001057EC86|nr:hypothetical protein [Phenylobacterium hankyongense]